VARLAQFVPDAIKRPLLAGERWVYTITVAAATPVNAMLAALLKRRVVPGSVLHVSGMVHVAFHTVRLLREQGINADYLAIGGSPWWDDADFKFTPTRVPLLSVLNEMWWVWSVVSRYETIHSHFMALVSRGGWEWRLLRRMGRRIVVHYRGCEVRDRDLNQRLHPTMNICEECDYHPRICEVSTERRAIAQRYGNAFLVTTPDMKDFAPEAVHVPFFVMNAPAAAGASRPGARFKIVHATNHPGIEGTAHIHRAVESLRAKGYDIDFVDLRGVPHERVLRELKDADVSVGKLKMGYYANFQVESLAAGVPAITYVRPELMTPTLDASGLIFATPATLEATLERLISCPEELAAKRRVARSSVAQLHDNRAIVDQLKAVYRALSKGAA
jgi:hypothetical protein